MSRITRILSIALVASLGLLMFGGPALAQPTVTDGLTIEGVTGDVTGEEFVGDLTIESFDYEDGDLTIDGVLEGTVNGEEVTQEFTDVTADLTRGGNGNACDILFLDIGPIFLDALGLQVDLSQIELDVRAVPGPGNLLGNLLCAVAGLLDGPDAVGGAIDRLLNRINDLIGGLLG